MEGTLEGDQPGPPGGVAGQLDGPLHRFRAAVGEENLVELARRQRSDTLRELDGRLMVGDDGDVHQLVELLVRGFDHFRMAVPQVGDTDPRGEIEITAAAHRIEKGELRANASA